MPVVPDIKPFFAPLRHLHHVVSNVIAAVLYRVVTLPRTICAMPELADVA
jgi:hypothetical protein